MDTPQNPPSELRYDTISQDWVVIASGRAKRPDQFKSKRKKVRVSRAECFFCHPNILQQERAQLVLAKAKSIPFDRGLPESWTVAVIPNKYPAFTQRDSLDVRYEGEFYRKVAAVGFHEVIVTRNHSRQMALMSVRGIREVLEAYHLRYLALKQQRFVNHIAIFHNHGLEVGGSIPHPHSQLVTTPLVDSDLQKALVSSRQYFREHNRCAYCSMNAYELGAGKRIVFENAAFVVLCPFASKSAFEMIISPKEHRPYFEEITEEEKGLLAEAFKEALGRMYRGLQDPAYNFYLHTAPCDGSEHPYYHYHWTILPKTSIWAGFELGTRMEISSIEPEAAAEYLRGQ